MSDDRRPRRDDSRKPRRDGGSAGPRSNTTGPRRSEDEAAPADSERIAKRLSRAGIASRREAESLIAAGRIKVNGKVLDSPALNVGPADIIELDGNPIPTRERTRLFLFHKPSGLVTTNRDPQGRRTVFDALPPELPRLMTVGRLDINTEGLLLLTNDGGLARVLELPSTGWLRRYRVRVHGEVDEAALAGLKDGMAVDGVFYGGVEAALDRRQGTNAWLTVGLREGKNREVKNIMAALGLEVTRLIRVSYGPFQLGELEEGAVRELKGRMLRDQLGPRLIDEAGADFEAPLNAPPPTAQPPKPDRDARRPKGGARQPREEEGGLIRRGRRPDRPDRNDRRDAALSRLSTSAPKRGPKRREEEERPAPRSRSANVWIAPGARPTARGEGAVKMSESEVRVPRKPGDRKARMEPDKRQPRPPRGDDKRPPREAGDTPRARPASAGGDGQRADRPKRDWKAKPPRPGKAERAEARTTGSAPPREYRPRPRAEGDGNPAERKPWKGGESRPARPAMPERDRKPRPEGDRRPPAHSRDGADGGAGKGKGGPRPPSGGSRPPRAGGSGGPYKGPHKGPAKGPGKGPGRK